MSTAKQERSSHFSTGATVKRLMLQLFICMVIASTMILAMAVSAHKNDTSSADHQAREKDAYSIGVQAYIYGLAPVILQQAERNFTTTPGAGHAPVNQFGHISRLATPNDTVIVSPNSDTLYSVAWLELGKGPIVLHVPDTNGRYYVMQLLDAYTNSFNSVGRRTTGTKEGDFAIVGPEWNGSLPSGVTEIRSPTNTVWVLGRTLVDGEGDMPAATAIQKQFTLTPLSQFGRSSVPVAQSLSDFKRYAPSPDAQNNLTFFEELRAALKNNPPPKGEEALMAVFGRIGLGMSETPYGKSIDPADAAGLARALRDGDQIIKDAWVYAPGKAINGWIMKTDIGTYGYDYLTRAVVAEGGLGANLPQEAVYPKAEIDGNGDPLNGANKYVIHFAKGNLPPVDAFWSLTAYNATTYMLVPNAINRYAIGDRTQGLKYGPDGSLDIYIQYGAPAEAANWLPAPEGNFYLILRMYQPRPEVLNGTYQIPPVKAV